MYDVIIHTRSIHAIMRTRKYDDDPGGTSDSGCQACPTHTYAFAESIGLASCFCNMGYTGPNGGPCTACRPGELVSV